MLCDGAPFVLLDDSRDVPGPARLYRAPRECIAARSPEEVAPALDRLRAALAGGQHAAGFLGYGAGHALEPRLAPTARAGEDTAPPLLWFGLFDAVELLDSSQVEALLPDPAGAWLGPPVPRIARDAYRAAFDRVADYIAAGDIYQANLSFRADVPVAGHPLALYARLRAASRAGWGGIAFTGDHWLLSASPELFFTLEAGAITTRPMKGTTLRGVTPAADAIAAAALLADPKQRAENLMIVDLLRNDIARVAVPGSVAVPDLFTVETYPTLHTLTSTVTGTIDPARDAVDVLAALFPCGSVTGAPKIRARQIIDEVEHDARDVYTGSLGWLAPDGDAGFNVLIRTLVLDDAARRKGHGTASIGLGGAIVADSTADAEWAEALAKGAFVTHGARDFELIETMGFDPQAGLPDWPRHRARLMGSVGVLGFALPDDLDDQLKAATTRLTEPSRLRLSLARDGSLTIATAALPPATEGAANVVLRPLPVDPTDFRLRHKTSDRAFHDDARTASGAFEVLFVDPEGYLTEGSFTTIFVERDGILLIPPLTRGLLPGILRQRLIEEGRAREADLTPADLSDGLFIGNALRGLMPAIIDDRLNTPA